MRFWCNHCQFEATTKRVMLGHVVARHTNKEDVPFYCSSCEFASINRRKVDKHISARHQGAAVTQEGREIDLGKWTRRDLLDIRDESEFEPDYEEEEDVGTDEGVVSEDKREREVEVEMEVVCSMEEEEWVAAVPVSSCKAL